MHIMRAMKIMYQRERGCFPVFIKSKDIYNWHEMFVKGLELFLFFLPHVIFVIYISSDAKKIFNINYIINYMYKLLIL